MATKIPVGSLPANFLPDRGLGFPSFAPFFSSAIFPVPRRAVALRAVTASKPSAPPAGKREPRGITKPRPISPELQDLVGVPEIARTQALKLIWAYIKQHDFQVTAFLFVSLICICQLPEEIHRIQRIKR
ncbi:hypothetical protein J5N97_028572 [Dioscorea zingiberensis]|uniref:SWIB domain-containing protein n=1 Tax=Dioscorea zingiberensis TaxID=325984 RepID=A0A9D5H4Z5_9LILI|nr:hypothetical protein J5N97_028572 [Dioscorea zingiberensis]